MHLMKPIGPLFRRTRHLEGQIDEFLDCLASSGMLFQKALKGYFEDEAG